MGVTVVQTAPRVFDTDQTIDRSIEYEKNCLGCEWSDGLSAVANKSFDGGTDLDDRWKLHALLPLPFQRRSILFSHAAWIFKMG